MKQLAFWPSRKPIKKEKKFLRNREFLEKINHIDQLWEYLKDKYGDVMAVNDLRGKYPDKYTYAQLADLINHASKAFLNLGLKKGDVVSLIAENSPRWLIVDQAIMRLGAIDAVRGCNSPSIELDYIIKNSNSIGLVIQSREIWMKLSNRDNLKKSLKFVIILEDDSSEDLIGWSSFIKSVDKAVIDKDLTFQNSHKITDTATILYTSGTTGEPKGVPLTHQNLLHQITNLACIADPRPGSSVLSVLPIWHSYERSAEYFFFSCGCSQFYTTPKFLKDDIKEVKPVLIATVPRLWEAIHDGFFLALNKMPKNKKKILKILLKNSSIYKKDLRRIKNLEIDNVPWSGRIYSLISISRRYFLHQLSTLFFWPGILKQLCGVNLKFPINGGGALPEHVDLFFEALGIDVLVGYGLTETSPVLTCRRTWTNVRGTSGQPLPFTEVKIVNEEKGEILNYKEIGKIIVRGPQVMQGYLNNKEATNKVLTNEGWFDTGDLGFLIPNGALVITGRAKDTIVLSSGENIEPNPLEIEILSSEFIDQVQLVGQDKKSLSAIIVPNIELINSKFLEKDLKRIYESKKIKSFYKMEVNTLLKKRTGARMEEQIIDCLFVDPFTIDNGLLTQTLKQKRKEIEKIYEREIEEIYTKRIKRQNMI